MEVSIAGPVGKLRGEFEEPEVPPWGQALVCHPHPAHGGSLRNSIVVRVARALRAAGLATLRFNFRGVEGSEGGHDGVQEIEDAAAALRWLTNRAPAKPLWGAGYSFGSRIVAELAQRDQNLERLALIAFPCALYDPRVLLEVHRPGLLVFGSVDAFGNEEALRRSLPSLPPDWEVVQLAGADHFFRGRTPLVEEAVLRYARTHRPPAPESRDLPS